MKIPQSNYHFLFSEILSVIFLTLQFQQIIISSAYAQSAEYDQKLKISLNSVVPESLANGKHYSIDPVVHSDGYMNKYTIRTKFGAEEVRGTYFLIKRITEIDALIYINDNYGSVQLVQNSVSKSAEGVVLGPVKAADKLYQTVSDSKKLEATIKSAPDGIANLFKMAAATVGDVSDFAYQTGKSAFSSNNNSVDKKSVDYSTTRQIIEKGALDLIGYNKSFRELAKSLKVDPYSENAVLVSELRRVASVQTAADLGSKFVPSLYSIPGVGTANKYLGYADRAATYQDPGEVDKLNRQILDSLGYSSEEKKKSSVDQLFKNHNYTPPMRNEIASALKNLQKVGQADSLLIAASQAESREIAQFYVLSIEKLAELSLKGTVMKSFIADTKLPAAITDRNRLIVPLPVDYLFWTPEVSKIFSYFKKKADSQSRIAGIEIILGGKISPKARSGLTKSGVSRISESVQFSYEFK